MDYDKTEVPEAYDAGRALTSDDRHLLNVFFAAHMPAAQISHVIDLGCGTGRFTGILAGAFNARVTGIDPSEKMLARARAKHAGPRFTFLHGPAETLPLEDNCADLVFMSMVDHHLHDPEGAAHECHRILRPGGHVFIRNTVADETRSYPYLDFFPSLRKIIEQSLNSRTAQDTRHAKAGFRLITRQSDHHDIAPNWLEFAGKMSLRADSFVARLDDEEYRQGLAAIEAHAETAPADEPVGLIVDMVLYQRE